MLKAVAETAATAITASKHHRPRASYLSIDHSIANPHTPERQTGKPDMVFSNLTVPSEDRIDMAQERKRANY